MAKAVRWTEGAQSDRKEILRYWTERNRSSAYSIKLNQLFTEHIKLIQKYPAIGRNYGRDDIRLSVVRDYIIVYREMEKQIVILSIWDSRQDPNRLDKKV